MGEKKNINYIASFQQHVCLIVHNDYHINTGLVTFFCLAFLITKLIIHSKIM